MSKESIEEQEELKNTSTEETEQKEEPTSKDQEKAESSQKESNSQGEEASSDTTKEENVDYKDRYVRLYSDFENFRKRSAKEKVELIHRASGDLAKDILPVVDDFERAMKVNEETEESAEAKEGFKLIYDKLVKTLASKGVKEMDAKGKAFDVDKHEAITQIPAGDEMKGKVVDVLEKGYYINDSVLRYAKVVVGQ